MLIYTEFFYPEFFLTITLLSLLLFATIYHNNNTSIVKFNKFINFITSLSLILTFIMYFYISDSLVSNVLINNSLITTIKLIIVFTAIIIINLPSNLFNSNEFTILILISVLGMNIIISSKDLIMLYLGIELLSLSLYILAAIKRNSEYSTEAGLKYFILGAVASGIYLFGSVIIYLITGSTEYISIENYLNYETTINIGAIFIIIALLFKLAAAPFHMWIADVYEGSPTIVTAFFAIVPKISILGALIILLTGAFSGIYNSLQTILIISTILSLIVGAIGALNQSKIKRIFAYSAIGHIGFIFLGLITGSLNGYIASLTYIFIYIIMTIFTFTVILILYKNSATPITNIIGLSRNNKILALSFALVLMSIAGVPPLAGFLSKLLVLNAAILSQLWLITIIAIITSVISAFYYLQLIKLMFFKDMQIFNYKVLSTILVQNSTITTFSALILGLTTYLILTLLINPSPILAIANEVILSTLI
jgi:NADH-quinone oxidoreductase subunit N